MIQQQSTATGVAVTPAAGMDEWQLPEAYAGIYASLFWRSYLGHAYDLWDVLVAMQRRLLRLPAAERRWPPLHQLADHLGYGTRHALTGRRRSPAHPGQDGLLSALSAERLVAVWVDGVGRQQRYQLDVYLPPLPCLTPAQVGALSPALQDDHAGILREMFPVTLCRRWHQVEASTLIPFLIPPLSTTRRR